MSDHLLDRYLTLARLPQPRLLYVEPVSVNMTEIGAGSGDELFGALCSTFAEVLRNTDLKPSTVATYLRAFPVFARWFAEAKERHDPATLIRFKGRLEGQVTLSASTKSLYLNAARLFYRRLFELGVLDRNFAASVRGFQPSSRHKRAPISSVDIGRVFESAGKSGDLRLVAILNLLYRQGLRRQEVVNVRVVDVDFASGVLLVLGKGRDDYEPTPLHPMCADAIRVYLLQADIRDGFLFPSRKRVGQAIGGMRVYQIIESFHEQLGITANVHAYRKAFTSQLIDAGMNLLAVQQFTRHRSLGMLKVYYDRIDQRKALPLFVSALA